MRGFAISLGLFVPQEFDTAEIANGLLSLIEAHGVDVFHSSLPEVREPQESLGISRYNTASSEWHQDCGGVTKYMIIWSNKEQTEVRLKGVVGSELWFPQGHVLLLNNNALEHRTPPIMSCDRWFARSAWVNAGAARIEALINGGS